MSKKAKKVAKPAKNTWGTSMKSLRKGIEFGAYFYATTQKSPLPADKAEAWANGLASRVVSFLEDERRRATAIGVKGSAKAGTSTNVADLFGQLAMVAQQAAADTTHAVPRHSGIGVPPGIRKPSEPN